MGNTVAVLYQGAVVARATFEVLGEATPENAACAPRPEMQLEGGTVEGRLWVQRGQLYNHFKRCVGMVVALNYSQCGSFHVFFLSFVLKLASLC